MNGDGVAVEGVQNQDVEVLGGLTFKGDAGVARDNIACGNRIE